VLLFFIKVHVDLTHVVTRSETVTRSPDSANDDIDRCDGGDGEDASSGGEDHRSPLHSEAPTAIYKLEMKIEEEKRVLKELTALEAIDREIKELNKEIQVNNNFSKSFSNATHNASVQDARSSANVQPATLSSAVLANFSV
jgi:hypothetical protein